MTKRKAGDAVCSHCGIPLMGRRYNNRRCPKCRKELLREYHQKHYADIIKPYQQGYRAGHLKQMAARMNEYRRLNPEVREKQMRYLKDFRMKVITGYGGKCQCCGEGNYEFLAVDHVKGGGGKDRKTRSPWMILKQIIKDNYPTSFRVLCHNCNGAIGYYGYCPHKREG